MDGLQPRERGIEQSTEASAGEVTWISKSEILHARFCESLKFDHAQEWPCDVERMHPRRHPVLFRSRGACAILLPNSAISIGPSENSPTVALAVSARK